ncbi:MAG TPA: hypothetical protein VFX59_29115 [Polyangiales bacterium]|nr:hypothetical protein [Polyangiales bacterium]
MYKQASLVQRHLLTLFVSLLGASCAHPSPEQTAAQFRELSRHEAELARAEAERGKLVAAQADECAPPVHDATQRVCGESAEVCTLSKALHDRDAETRCLRAQDACQAAREHVRARCK